MNHKYISKFYISKKSSVLDINVLSNRLKIASHSKNKNKTKTVNLNYERKINDVEIFVGKFMNIL